MNYKGLVWAAKQQGAGPGFAVPHKFRRMATEEA
jgi:hypothetical protein